VSVGMVLAARLSVNLGMLKAPGADMITELAVSAGLPVKMEVDPEVIYGNIRKDKKKSGEQLYLVLLEGLGNATVRSMPFLEFKAMLHDLY
jgi:3-dehydroquinate synthase